MRVGFTGTRKGLTGPQALKLRKELRFDGIEQGHHGDCIGGDEEFHEAMLYMQPHSTIIIHPPKDDRYRAYCGSLHILPEQPYLKRNRDIVHASDFLIVCPKETKILSKGTKGAGTWYTYHYAQDQGVKTLIIWPDGNTRLSVVLG